jgi:hypothetical protein
MLFWGHFSIGAAFHTGPLLLWASNDSGIWSSLALGVAGYLLGVASDLLIGFISSQYSTGHITLHSKKVGWVLRLVLWIRAGVERSLERIALLKPPNPQVQGVYFIYRLVEMGHNQYIWEYSELELSINLSNEVKGTNTQLTNEVQISSEVAGNFVQDRMLILFLFDRTVLTNDTADKMITVPDFRDDSCNLGWVINSSIEDKRPMPVVFRKEMLNFPKQLLKDERVYAVCAPFAGNIHWKAFKNELE